MNSRSVFNKKFRFTKFFATLRLLFISMILFVPHATLADFSYDRVQYKVSYVDKKYIGLSATFYGVTTDVIKKPKFQFTIGFDGDMDIGYFKSTRFDERSFHIPSAVSHDAQPGKFFVYPTSINNGRFRKFFYFLSLEEQSLLEGACRHFLDNSEIAKLLSSSTASHRAKVFLSLSKHNYDINTLAAECTSEARKEFARDLQGKLTELGYDLGSVDGRWGTDQVSGNLNYDFYSFDIGKPTSRYKNVGDGIGYKEHENGFVAYNINKSEKSFKRTNGQTVKVPKKSGLFCRDLTNEPVCLSID